MRPIGKLPSPMTRPPTRSARSCSVPNIARLRAAGCRGRLLRDVQRFLDVRGDVDAAVADAFASEHELERFGLRDLLRGIANLLRQLIGIFEYFACMDDAARCFCALLPRPEAIAFSSTSSWAWYFWYSGQLATIRWTSTSPIGLDVPQPPSNAAKAARMTMRVFFTRVSFQRP